MKRYEVWNVRIAFLVCVAVVWLLVSSCSSSSTTVWYDKSVNLASQIEVIQFSQCSYKSVDVHYSNEVILTLANKGNQSVYVAEVLAEVTQNGAVVYRRRLDLGGSWGYWPLIHPGDVFATHCVSLNDMAGDGNWIANNLVAKFQITAAYPKTAPTD